MFEQKQLMESHNDRVFAVGKLLRGLTLIHSLAVLPLLPREPHV
jgi:hypothetical protein